MNDLNDNDTWYKRCLECHEWRVTDMKHCWKCGAVLGSAQSLDELMASKRPAFVDVRRLSAVRRLYQRATELGYEHEEESFFRFFETLNEKRK